MLLMAYCDVFHLVRIDSVVIIDRIVLIIFILCKIFIMFLTDTVQPFDNNLYTAKKHFIIKFLPNSFYSKTRHDKMKLITYFKIA